MAMRVRHHWGPRAGHAFKGVARERGRAIGLLVKLPEGTVNWWNKEPGAVGTLPPGCERIRESRRYREASESDGPMAILVEHSTDGTSSWRGPVRWGTKAQGTHCREGETGHNVLLGGTMEDTLRSQTVSTKLQQIAEQATQYPE